MTNRADIAQRVLADVGQAVEPALSTLAQTVLGAICVVCLGVACLAVWKLLSVQEKATLRSERHNEGLKALADKMTETLNKFDKTLDRQIQASQQSQELQKEHTRVLTELQTQFVGTIRDIALENTRSRHGRHSRREEEEDSSIPPRPGRYSEKGGRP